MREHPTKPGYDSNDLAARMALTAEGQVTWVDLNLRSTCGECAHYRDARISQGKHKGFGRCALVKAHTRKDGKPFDGKSARACSKFEDQQ